MISIKRAAEHERHIAELNRLLSSDGLTPDTRAKSLAALIEAHAMAQIPAFADAIEEFYEAATSLAANLKRFNPDG